MPKQFAVAILDSDGDIDVIVVQAEDWRKAIIQHDYNPFIDSSGESDITMIPEEYAEAVTESFELDCGLCVKELKVGDTLLIEYRNVE